MRFAGVTFVGLLFALCDADAAPDSEVQGMPGNWRVAANELKLLQGAWEVVHLEWGGDILSPDKFQQWQVTIYGDKFTLRVGELSGEGHRLTLTPGKKPARIDLYSLYERRYIAGIYKAEKNRLTICYTIHGKENRPKEFISQVEPRTDLIVLQRKRK